MQVEDESIYVNLTELNQISTVNNFSGLDMSLRFSKNWHTQLHIGFPYVYIFLRWETKDWGRKGMVFKGTVLFKGRVFACTSYADYSFEI